MNDEDQYIKKFEDRNKWEGTYKGYGPIMEKSFNIIVGSITAIIVVYGMYYIGLYHFAIISFSLAGLIIFSFVLRNIRCIGKSGCISGVILVPALMLIVLGAILLGVDYFLN